MNKVVAHILEIGCSGLAGVVLSIGYNHFLAPSQSFTFIYNGEEVVVTESTYSELVEENSALNKELSSVQKQLSDLQTQIDQQNSTEEIEKIIQNATEYWNSSDYLQCLTLLKNSKSKSTDIESLYKQYSIEYCNVLLLQADQYISERNYDEAIKILSEGSILVNDNESLNNKIKEIKNKPSALLSNLTPVSGDIESIWNAGQKDNYNNSYTSGICLQQYHNEAAHVVYSLDGKYTVLTGKFVLTEDYKNTDGNYVLYAYSLEDGEMKFINKSSVLSTATRPIDIKFDVTGVMDLVLEVYDSNKSNNNAKTGFVDAKLE